MPQVLRRLMVMLGIAILFSSCAGMGRRPASPRPASVHPNVIVVLVDDLGWADLSVQGSPFIETPNIDRLAREGMRFTNAYAAAAVCSPSRAALLTGRYPTRTGITDYIRPLFIRDGVTPKTAPTEYVGAQRQKLICPPNPFWLEHEEVTLAELLRDSGYRTAHVGKWHLGDPNWYPESQGFDVNVAGSDLGRPPSYFDPYTNLRLPNGIPTLAPRKEGEYLTDRETDEAISFVRAHRDRPFFVHLSHHAVHLPLRGKPDYVKHYREKKSALKLDRRDARHAAMVQSVDESLGRLRDALYEEGIDRNTLIIFTSDNGGLLGPTRNDPLRGGKGDPYEGGIRVPFIVCQPGVIEPSGSNAVISGIDVLPTVLDITATPKLRGRAMDGISLAEHIATAGRTSIDRDAIFWHFPHYNRRETPPYSAARIGDEKLIRWYEGPTYELYDLATDIGETRNLAPERPERVRELDARLAAHLEEVGARMPRRNPNWQPAKKVLLLGDSISIGYTDTVRNQLADIADVYRPVFPNGPQNCQGTDYGLERIDRWLNIAGGDFDLIHFNFGLHDLKRVDPETGRNSRNPDHPHQTSPEEYGPQLESIVDKLQETGAQLIFASTTPVPEGTGIRTKGDAVRYNEIALRIMRERGIEVNDLFTYALENQTAIQIRANVHFTLTGSRRLAAVVSQRIRAALIR